MASCKDRASVSNLHVLPSLSVVSSTVAEPPLQFSCLFFAFFSHMDLEVYQYTLKLPSLPLGQMELIKMIKEKIDNINSAVLMKKHLWI